MRGNPLLINFLMSMKLKYPQYIQELQGIAEGSDIPFINLFMINLRYELSYFVNNSTGLNPLQCADIHVINSENVFVAHNEDAAPIIASTAYLLTIQIPESNQLFTAYTYPGYLPGVAFGWNSFVSLSFNYVGPLQTQIGLARAFINRDALAATSAQDAFMRITPTRRAFGFTLNLGDFMEQKSYSIEVSPNAFAYYENLKNYTHFNEYKLLNIPQATDTSTIYRQERADKFGVPQVPLDALEILGDNMNKVWPIYRNAAPPDTAATVATVLFDILERRVSVWDSNPKSSLPQYVFSVF